MATFKSPQTQTQTRNLLLKRYIGNFVGGLGKERHEEYFSQKVKRVGECGEQDKTVAAGVRKHSIDGLRNLIEQIGGKKEED